MKTLFASLLVLSTIGLANAGDLNLNNFSCVGQAEYNQVVINSLSVNQNKVSITFTTANKTLTQNYILTEKFKNQVTDANQKAYFVGATKSGDKNDFEDIALPHLGLYKSGKFESEIAFNINGNRVFGTVECK